MLTGAAHAGEVENILFAEDEYDGDLLLEPDGVELQMGRLGYGLPYPFPLQLLHRTAERLQREYDEEVERDGDA
jgi:hypothetical protein